MKIVVDSSVFIDFIRAKKGLYVDISEYASTHKVDLYAPATVILELWSGQSMTNPKIAKEVEQVVSICKSQVLSEDIAKIAGELIRKKYISEFADATIAATALHLNAYLTTQNIKHFKNIPNLKLFNF